MAAVAVDHGRQSAVAAEAIDRGRRLAAAAVGVGQGRRGESGSTELESSWRRLLGESAQGEVE